MIISAILGGSGLKFFVHYGFENIVNIADENPEKVIPKALLISIVVMTVFYILVAVTHSALVGWKELSLSEAPLPLAAEKSFGILSFCTLIALFATSNTPLVLISQVTIVFCDHYYCYCNFGYLLIAEMQPFPYQMISTHSIFLSVNISAVHR